MKLELKEFSEALAKALPGAGNVVALGEFDITLTPAVEHDADKVPIAWRIFKYGTNEIYQSGQRYNLVFSDEVFDAIIAYFTEKGTKIPLDSKHFLYRLAEHYGVSEKEILKVLPDGRGTFGFGALEKRQDGLWITQVEYVPLARKLMADGSFRYFSPVIRGLSDGHFRVTSVAMLNEPAINNLDSLAASAENVSCGSLNELTDKLDVIAASANIATQNHNKEMCVKNMLTAIAVLLGMDSLSLGADGNAPEGVVEKINNLATEVKDLREGKQVSDDFLAAIREPLALAADADLNAAQGTILSMVEKGKNADEYKTRLDALELAAETAKKNKLIEDGKVQGKLTENMITEWASKQDSAALSAFLETAPVVVPVNPIDRVDLDNPDQIALTAEDKETCQKLGVSEEDMLKAKKGEI